MNEQLNRFMGRARFAIKIFQSPLGVRTVRPSFSDEESPQFIGGLTMRYLNFQHRETKPLPAVSAAGQGAKPSKVWFLRKTAKFGMIRYNVL